MINVINEVSKDSPSEVLVKPSIIMLNPTSNFAWQIKKPLTRVLHCDKTWRAFYTSRVFLNVRSVLSQCNTQLRRLHLPYDIEIMWREMSCFLHMTFRNLKFSVACRKGRKVLISSCILYLSVFFLTRVAQTGFNTPVYCAMPLQYSERI